MVIGKTGVGKSATVNSIFDEVKVGIDSFQVGTKKVQDIVGIVQGIKVRIIDTPGLLPSCSDQHHNKKILQYVKRFMEKTPPDIILYLDRLDMQSNDLSNMSLFRTITKVFGPLIWFNAVVALTHAASASPEGPTGTSTSYDMYVSQRAHVIQQAIRLAAGDIRLKNPVSLVENHSACRMNRARQRVLPNGQVWIPHLLLLSFASKILAQTNILQNIKPRKPAAARVRSPPLHIFLSSLLQSIPRIKLPAEQNGVYYDDTLDADLEESSDSDNESDYDKLPPFKRLTKAQLAKHTREQKKNYNNELEYREKKFMKKQLKEVRKKRKIMRKAAGATKILPSEYNEYESVASSASVPMPDRPLSASFDSDYPTHRYRCLDSKSPWLVRSVLQNNGWDHDVGYEGINEEKFFVLKDRIPVSFSGQVVKDKKDLNIQMEVAGSVNHSEGRATSFGFDMRTMGKDINYLCRSETRFSNHKLNKATAGLSVALGGDLVTGGVKFEDKLIVSKRGQLVISGGGIVAHGDSAWGGSLEETLRDKDHPLGRFLSPFGLSFIHWHGDLAIGWNIQSKIPIGRFSNLVGRINFNNRGAGQVSMRLNSSEHLQIALLSFIRVLGKLFCYSQSWLFGQ